MDRETWAHEYDLARQDISRNIRRKLRERRINQKTLAALMGVHQGSVSAVVKGKRMPSAMKLKQIANALGCTTDELLEGVGE